MALPSTVHRFLIDLSDVDRGVYEALDLRTARHPSESMRYLMTRVLAYALEHQDGLELSRGLCEPDEPALHVQDPTGRRTIWIEVGNPTADRLHAATKLVPKVKIYTYKDPTLVVDAVAARNVHRADEVELVAFDPEFLDTLAEGVGRRNSWTLVRSGGDLFVTIGETTVTSSPVQLQLESG